MPQLCLPPDEDDEPVDKTRRMSATSLGAESTKTVVSGVSDLDANIYNEMSDRVAGLMSRGSRVSNDNTAHPSCRSEDVPVQDTIFQFSEHLRPKAYSFENATEVPVPSLRAGTPGLQ